MATLGNQNTLKLAWGVHHGPDGHRAGDYSNVRDLMDALSSGVNA